MTRAGRGVPASAARRGISLGSKHRVPRFNQERSLARHIGICVDIADRELADPSPIASNLKWTRQISRSDRTIAAVATDVLRERSARSTACPLPSAPFVDAIAWSISTTEITNRRIAQKKAAPDGQK
jgi:hypothetical protein